jgi:hypothetical protein
LIHGVRPRIQDSAERGHVVHQLDEDGHVVIALAGEPLHLGVDPRLREKISHRRNT